MRNLATLESETNATVARCRAQINAIRERAADEGRAETAEERADIDRLLREANSAKTRLDRERSDDAMRVVLEGLVPATPLPGGPGRAMPSMQMVQGHGATLSLGAQFERALGQWFRDTRGKRASLWHSPSVELAWQPGGGVYAATITGDPASGGDLVVADTQPGIVPSATRPLAVADLFASSTTDSNLITYMKETSFTNAADTVAEGIAKPESTLTFDAVSDPVRKVAHWLPVTDEMLEDVPQLRGYIDARLRLGVQLTLDDQLLNGTATAPDIVGIRNRTGLGPDVVKAAAPDTAGDAFARAIAQVQTTTGLAASGIVMHPNDWTKIQLAKTSTGEYYGGSPFVQLPSLSLWGVPVAITNVMPEGTGLVGAFRSAAMVFYKGGLRVEASNSHQDYFVLNKTAIRSELRAALAVMVPAAFCEVTGL